MSEASLQQELNRAQARVAELEQQLRESQAQTSRETHTSDALTSRMRHLLDLLPAGVIVLDNTGHISDCNPAAESLLGESLRGRQWGEVITSCFAPRSDDGHEVSLKSGRRVSLATQAMDQEPGQLILLTDMTETRLLQGRVSHYQRLSEMGRMVASLAHQVRTPLSAAMLYAGHLARPELSETQRLKFAGKIRTRLGHLEHQVRDMLTFARGETRLDDRLTTQQLAAALDDMLDVPLTQADADCELINQAPDIMLQCNRETLLGALMNLVNNALDACGQGAELVVRFYLFEQWLCLAVEDNGPGMDAEKVRQVMEPFYTTKSHGTGLGLAVAQVVARGHHGEFELLSIPGQGTRAVFLLPYMTGDQPEQTSAHAEG